MIRLTDIHVLEFARYLSFLEPFPPVTKELDKWGSRYPSQKVHICDWLRGQMHVFKGAYGRDRPNESAKIMYNRFLNPGGLIWIADVLGEKEAILREATAAAIKAEKVDYRGRCIAFRRVIPWARIMHLFSDCGRWQFDKQMVDLIEADSETGLPKLKDDPKAQRGYRKIFELEHCFEESPPKENKRLTKAEKKARGWEV